MQIATEQQRNHLVPNTPFLLSPVATSSWPARRNWVLPTAEPHSSSGAPSLPNLTGLAAYGDQIVPVADTAVRQFSEFERDERPLGDILDVWRRGEGATLYVKDWHLVAELEERGGRGSDVYSPPECLRDDWLSPPFDAPRASSRSASTADFRFVYAGPSGTFTPLHRDVYASYSWSANVVGRKVWWLFPPGSEVELGERGRDELMFDVRGDTREALGVKILQGEGEVLFVPSGWHHQVVNVDFVVSINHNFFASPTLPRIYDAMRVAQRRVAAAIDDVKADIRTRLGDAAAPDGTPLWEEEWAEEVDMLLERDSGWGWTGFWTTVRDNLKNPPAEHRLSPPIQQRNEFVSDVLAKYKASREWRLLSAAREVALEVQGLLSASTGKHAGDE